MEEATPVDQSNVPYFDRILTYRAQFIGLLEP